MKTTKQLFSMGIILFLMQWMGGLPYAYSNDLSSEQEISLLNDISNSCVDTWCEGGERIYNLDEFDCWFDKGLCVISFRFVAMLEKEPPMSYECIIPAESADELIDDSEGFIQISKYLDEEVEECMYSIYGH